jgi:DNA-binding transcriptional LysR family regulator
MAQPAPFISIHKHEESLNVRLFARGPLGLALTRSGVGFLGRGKAPAVTHRAGTAVWALPSLAGGAGGSGVSAAQCIDCFRGFLGFIAKLLGVRFDLFKGVTVYLTDRVRDGRLDAGMIRTPVEDTSKLNP